VVDVDFSTGPSAFPVTGFAVGAHDHYAIAMSSATGVWEQTMDLGKTAISPSKGASKGKGGGVGKATSTSTANSLNSLAACCKIYDLLSARRNARQLRAARKQSLPKGANAAAILDASLHTRAPFSAPKPPSASSAAGEAEEGGGEPPAPLPLPSPAPAKSSRRRTGRTGGGSGDGTGGGRGRGSPAALAASTVNKPMPPFRLARRVGGIEKPLNMRRMQALLATRGALPKKYRTLVWRFLLQLPENQELFTQLLAKGIHPAYQDLPARYPLRDSRVLRKLQLVLSALAYWSPICGELEYLPSTVFPFVLVFEVSTTS
jgi:hypothetical protein